MTAARIQVLSLQAKSRGISSGWDDEELGEELGGASQPQQQHQQQKKSSVVSSGPAVTPVFVGNLPFEFNREQLFDLAKTHGAGASQGLKAARIQMDVKIPNKSRGFGYLDYSLREEAEVAAAKLRGLEVSGRILKIDIDGGVTGPNRGRRVEPTSKDFSVFVGNLDFSLRAEDVEDIFRREILKDLEGFGPDAISPNLENGDNVEEGKNTLNVRCRLLTLDGRSKGMGHVDFADAEAVKQALFLNGFEVMGRQLIVERPRGLGAGPAAANREGTRNGFPPQEPSIFIGNLNFAVTADDIADMCNDILGPGVLKRVKLSVDRETGQFRGFGHLYFASQEDAQRALSELSDVELMDRRLRVDKATWEKDSTGGRLGGGAGGGRERGPERGGGEGGRERERGGGGRGGGRGGKR